MTSVCRTLSGLLTIFMMAHAADAQVPGEWRLASAPAFEVGGAEIELFRVTGAALLRSGNVAIADAGNRRILVVSPRGELVRTLGRAGDGPGEFRGLSRISVLGDTIVAYDAALSRTVVHDGDGIHVQTRALPPFGERPVFFRDALSGFRYIGISPLTEGSDMSGLFLDNIAIVVVDAVRGTQRHLATRESQYLYTVRQGPGTTTYLAPFLGQTHVAAVNERVVIVPRGGSTVEVLEPGGGATRQVELPIPRRTFDRAVISAHRDSVLGVVARSRTAAPGASERIRLVYGSRFPVPPGASSPAIQAAQVVGGDVWLQSVPASGERATTWYVIDPASARLVATISLPRQWNVLGGDARHVVVGARDEFDVEYVRVYPIVR